MPFMQNSHLFAFRVVSYIKLPICYVKAIVGNKPMGNVQSLYCMVRYLFYNFYILNEWCSHRSCQDLQDVSKIRITGFRLDIDGSSVEDIESGVSKIWIISINLSFHWQTFEFCSFIGNEYGFLWLVWTHQIMMNGFTNDSFPWRMHTTKNRYSVGTTETW